MAMTASSTDRIEKEIVLRAPRAKVWRALTDAREFSRWFGVEMTDPFVPGARARGRVTHPGYEHVPFELTVERMEPERLFSWRWHPYAVDAKVDYSKEPTTLVVFELEDVAGGTRLKIVESGFDQIPAERRAEAFRMNSGGWTQQVENIRKHVEQAR
jgi:uncharacterized protein YndB with AHSA1/START domain